MRQVRLHPMEQTDFLAIIRERGSGALDKKMGIEIIEASPQRLVGTMPVEGNTQPIGLLHGGANVVLAESLGSIGTQLHAGPTRRCLAKKKRCELKKSSRKSTQK